MPNTGSVILFGINNNKCERCSAYPWLGSGGPSSKYATSHSYLGAQTVRTNRYK